MPSLQQQEAESVPVDLDSQGFPPQPLFSPAPLTTLLGSLRWFSMQCFTSSCWSRLRAPQYGHTKVERLGMLLGGARTSSEPCQGPGSTPSNLPQPPPMVLPLLLRPPPARGRSQTNPTPAHARVLGFLERMGGDAQAGFAPPYDGTWGWAGTWGQRGRIWGSWPSAPAPWRRTRRESAFWPGSPGEIGEKKCSQGL